MERSVCFEEKELRKYNNLFKEVENAIHKEFFRGIAAQKYEPFI